MASRRRRPGSGSDLDELGRSSIQMDWWPQVARALAGIPHAVVGAVAANAYMPPRFTADLDVAVTAQDQTEAAARFRAAGFTEGDPLVLPEDANLGGTAWLTPDGHAVDLLVLSGPFGKQAIRAAGQNIRAGMPTLRLADLVVMKLAASRATDIADLTRLVGGAGDEALREVRAAVDRWGTPGDLDDLEQLIELGRLEYRRRS